MIEGPSHAERQQRYFRRRRWRRIGWLVMVLIVAGGAGLRFGRDPATLDVDRFHLRQFHLDVLQGDLLQLPDGTRVRLIGACCNNRPDAKHETLEFIGGNDVQLEIESAVQRNAAGELLAYAFVLRDGKRLHLNEHLIRQGLAFADRRWAFDCESQFRLLEQEAAGKRVGLWADFPDIALESMPTWRQRWWAEQQKPRWERGEWNTEPI